RRVLEPVRDRRRHHPRAVPDRRPEPARARRDGDVALRAEHLVAGGRRDVLPAGPRSDAGGGGGGGRGPRRRPDRRPRLAPGRAGPDPADPGRDAEPGRPPDDPERADEPLGLLVGQPGSTPNARRVASGGGPPGGQRPSGRVASASQAAVSESTSGVISS